MTTRRQIVLFSAAAIAAPLTSIAQTQKLPRIVAAGPELYRDALRQGLLERGYVEGKNILVEYRVFDGRLDALPGVIAETMALKPDVIVASSNTMVAALKKATQTIPIVMGSVGDPVGSGFVDSLGRPGGNITGLSNLSEGVSAKRFEILMEIRPRLSRVAVLRHGPNPTHATFYREIEAAARAAKVTPVPVDFRTGADFEDAFKTISRERADALVTLPDPVSTANRALLVGLSEKYKLPTIYPFSHFVENGGLVAYGASIADLWRRADAYVDRIVKGAKPAELPIEQPTKFELFFNLKTAKALGIAIPQSLLLRADKVIE